MATKKAPRKPKRPKRPKYIGLSLSLFIQWMINRDQPLITVDDVKYIVTGTCAPNPHKFREVVGEYRQGAWRDSPHRAARIAWALWRAEKKGEKNAVIPSRFVHAGTPFVTNVQNIIWETVRVR